VPVKDWKGDDYDPEKGPAAHPNSRFTVSSKRCPSYSEKAESAQGVPISAIIFGGRRASLIPLVTQARNWAHGVLMGATVASETTAAATGTVGVVRRDPMAMKPFCGYHFADYWSHWLSFEQKASKLPQVFTVNWFRKDQNNKFMWPGFGDNMRVLEWIINRVTGKVNAQSTAIGDLPNIGDINISGMEFNNQQLSDLLAVDEEKWQQETKEIEQYLAGFGDKVPKALFEELEKTRINILQARK
jgi:phosphoenolpyruvate carboxykinase (GTP)